MASGHALDLAASTAALCLLVGRLRGAPQLARLQISMLTAIEDGGGGPARQPMAARHAALEMRVLRSLKETMADNASLRCATLLELHLPYMYGSTQYHIPRGMLR